MSSLPFLTTGTLVEQGGAAVAGAEAVPCSVWPATSSRSSDVGHHHTHSGEAALEHADALQVANRSLILTEGLYAGTYKIVGATPNGFVPHVVLDLLRTSGVS